MFDSLLTSNCSLLSPCIIDIFQETISRQEKLNNTFVTSRTIFFGRKEYNPDKSYLEISLDRSNKSDEEVWKGYKNNRLDVVRNAPNCMENLPDNIT